MDAILPYFTRSEEDGHEYTKSIRERYWNRIKD